jgi:hypothetical protein
MSQAKIILTPDHAEGLLPEGEYVHNFIQSNFAFLGCDYARADAVKAFGEAQQIEIAGENAKAMRHPIAVFDKDGKLSFFEADMDKVAAFEAAALAKTEGC